VNEDIDVESEFGFEPAVSATGAAAEDRAEKRPRKPSRLGGLPRRIGALVVLLAALVSMGSM
jgi:hypothetical protein